MGCIPILMIVKTELIVIIYNHYSHVIGSGNIHNNNNSIPRSYLNESLPSHRKCHHFLRCVRLLPWRFPWGALPEAMAGKSLVKIW